MDFIFVKKRIMWCPNPTNVNSLGSGFGLQIYFLMGFLTVLQIQLQTQFKQSSYKYPVISSPKSLSFSDLVPYHLLYISLSSFVLPLLCLLSSFPLTSYSFLLFLAIHSQTPTYLPSLPLYNLFLVGFKSLLFCQIPCNPTFTQNPKESSCLLRILSKLVLDAKWCSAKTSQKHF